MSYKIALTIGVSLLIATFFGIGCCCGGGGGSDTDTETDWDFSDFEDFAEDIEELDTSGSMETSTGYITGPGMEQEFPVYTDKTPIDVTFDYDSSLDAYCKVLGMSRNELGTFRLNDGNIIELTGTGQFYLVVGSYGGAGEWTATYTP